MINSGKSLRMELVVCLFLAALTLVVYQQISNHGFISLDDHEYIVNNTHVHKGLTLENTKWAFTTTSVSYWQPLTLISHMLDFQFFGLAAGMHHLINLLIHLLNTLLLFVVLRYMTGAVWRSAFAAMLFAVHPLNVESVAWASERKNVLSTFFWILTMLTYFYYSKNCSLGRYLCVILVFALGLMAKPMLITLPFVLLLLDYWPLCRFQHKKHINGSASKLLSLILEKIPFLMLSAGSICISMLSVRQSNIVISGKSISVFLRLANALVSYVAYIKKMVWPSNLAIYYPYPKSLGFWETTGSGIFLGSITVLFLFLVRKKPYFAVGWFWYLGTLVPVIGLIQAGLWPAMADRFVYVPLIGLFIIVSWGGADIVSKTGYQKTICAFFGGTACIALAFCTWLQLHYWKDSYVLFEHAVHVTDNNCIAHSGLGAAFDARGRLDEAISQYYKALKTCPDDGLTHYGLGLAMAKQGNGKGAIYHFKFSLRIEPDNAEAYYNLGKVFLKQKMVDKGIENLQQALYINPDMTQTLYNLAWIRATSKEKKYRNGKKAVTMAKKLCELTHYRQPLALDALAAAYAETGRFYDAKKIARKGLQLALKYGPIKLAYGIKERLMLYKTGIPYREPD